MEFRSREEIAKWVGLAIGIIALSLIGMSSVATTDDYAFPVLMVGGFLMGLIGVAAATAGRQVWVDRERDAVDVTTRVGGYRWQRQLRVSSFHSVGLVTGGSNGQGAARIVYWVQLIGAENLTLPGGDTDLTPMLEKARELAEYASLELEEKPAVAFMRWRL